MNARCSTRTYSGQPITAEEKRAILHTAMRAPTAGNLMLYSIIEVEGQALKDRLAETCDHQPFIATAPWVLVFVADYQKWMDLFESGGAFDMDGVERRDTTGPGDLLLACSDALIAAQSAVIAAESLGIGSCYIGDILENGEQHAEMLGLPEHTLPIAMLCFGRPKASRAAVSRQERYVVMRDRYHRLTAEELAEVSAALEAQHAPHGLKPGITSYAQDVYRRKFVADFTREMNRSVAWWIERWTGR
jgi:FMN reductase (NADPH)/FMN reductase [NAD(P)H]